MLTLRRAAVTACFFVCAPLAAQPTHINLADYRLAVTYSLPPFVAEASGICYRPDSGTLFITGDEGLGIAEFTRRGTFVSQMSLTGFVDTEGLAFVGAGRFVITEERDQDAYLFMYAPGGSTARASMQSVSFGVTIGNIGIEGICYESLTDRYFAVKEKTPERILFGSINFAAGSTDAADLFPPRFAQHPGHRRHRRPLGRSFAHRQTRSGQRAHHQPGVRTSRQSHARRRCAEHSQPQRHRHHRRRHNDRRTRHDLHRGRDAPAAGFRAGLHGRLQR